MANTYTTLSGLFTATADAIRAKTGGTSPIKADDFPIEIANIPTGGGSVIPSDLPQDGALIVGYHIPEGSNKTVTLCYTHNTSDTATVIDWGDGETTINTAASGTKTNTHAYGTEGDHMAKVTINAGTIKLGGGNSSTIYGSETGSSTGYVRNYIQWVVVRVGITELDGYSFSSCRALQEIRLPSTGLTTFGNSVFSYCVSLKEIEIPTTVTTIGTNVFSYCTSLSKVKFAGDVAGYDCSYCYSLSNPTIPEGATSIGNNAFNDCWNLGTVTIPSTVTSIGTSAFAKNYGTFKIRFNSTTPPIIGGSNSFGGLPATCIISVPTGYLSAYTSASYYPSSSTYTYIEED